MRAVFEAQRAAFAKDPFPAAQERRTSLRRLADGLRENRRKLTAAVSRDFGGRAEEETSLAEVLLALNAARHAARSVRGWMAPRDRRLTWMLQPAQAWIQPQPLGVIGIVVPWNYPILLSITPLVCALAAGNRVMLKLSEHAPATADALATMLSTIYPADQVAVETGDAEAAREFSSLPFDHLLFTGSTAVGRDVLRSAAENLTPVTLELGGKSPAIIADDISLARAASDIVYGKLLNAGQTCIGVDYVLAPRNRVDAFVKAAAGAAQRFFPQGTASPEYTSILQDRHRERLDRQVAEARAVGVRIEPLFASEGTGKRMTPVILVDPPDDLPVMREEIFGPVLPVKPYDTLDEAIAYVNARPRPLALYVFTHSRAIIDQVVRRTVSGAVCVNDTLAHIVADNLPFGGVGPSGMGHYHGREGFDTFSKLKPVLSRRWPGIASILRPPYGRLQKRVLDFLLR